MAFQRSLFVFGVATATGMIMLSSGCGKLSSLSSDTTTTASANITRTYYIAADEVEWDYAPSGKNGMTDQAFGDQENTYVLQGEDRIGKKYKKAHYQEYTDASFSSLKPVPEQWQHKGILGPIIRAEVGDSIQVVFKNNTQFPVTIHPHGVTYTRENEGAGMEDSSSSDANNVNPGQTVTYRWSVPESAGPASGDPSSIVWLYHSHINEPAETNAGLIGAIIVTAKGMANSDGTPKDIDQEFVTLFTVMNENTSLYLDQNIQTYCGNPNSVNKDDEVFQESNMMHSINGYVFGNCPGLTLKNGARVRWYALSLGNEVDLHSAHWHGNTVILEGHRTDVVELLPASMKTVDMTASNPGTWMLHCHVNDHLEAGMVAMYGVQ